jgi:uncharacterized membrane protein
MGTLAALAGAEFVRRGATGSCPLYSMLGVGTASRREGAASSKGMGTAVEIRVDESITIRRPPEQVYRFWRDLGNLPRFLSHLERVEVAGNRSHWVAKGPAGRTVSWDAEIVNDIENNVIAWRSLPGSQVKNSGSVHFTPVGNSRGDATHVRIELQYSPPAGIAGALFAKLFGEEPSQQIRADLEQLKRTFESRSSDSEFSFSRPQSDLTSAEERY